MGINMRVKSALRKPLRKRGVCSETQKLGRGESMKNREHNFRQRRWYEPSDKWESHRMEHSTAVHINVYLLKPFISNYFPLLKH